MTTKKAAAKKAAPKKAAAKKAAPKKALMWPDPEGVMKKYVPEHMREAVSKAFAEVSGRDAFQWQLAELLYQVLLVAEHHGMLVDTLPRRVCWCGRSRPSTSRATESGDRLT
jgi:hypothetical protein